MGYILSYCKEKGGVGCSVGANNTAYALSKLNPKEKYILIDGDPQGNLTFMTTKNCSNLSAKNSSANLFCDDREIEPLQLKDNLYFLGNNGGARELNKFEEQDFSTVLGNLAKNIKKLSAKANIIIDLNSSLGNIATSSFIVSDFGIAPMWADDSHVFGLSKLLQAEDKLKSNPVYRTNFSILGVYFTNLKERGNQAESLVTRGIVKSVRKELGNLVFKTVIPPSKFVTESISNKQSVLEYMPKSNVSKRFEELAKEIDSRIKKRRRAKK